MRLRITNRHLLPLVAVLVLVATVLVGCAPAAAPGDPGLEVLTFAETFEFWTAPTLVASGLDLYAKEGLDVRVAKYNTGLDAMNAVLAGSADLGLVANTPVARAGFRPGELSLIATYFESDEIVKLVARGAGEGKLTPSFLVENNHRVGYVEGTISELVLERIIVEYDLDRDRIQRAVYTQPADLVYALGRGEIDAFVGWEPLPIQAERLMPGEIRVFSDPSLYTVALHLVTTPETIAEKGPALEKFVRALKRAEEAINEDSDGARDLVEPASNLEPGELAGVWEDLHFELKLDEQRLLQNLQSEGQWVINAGYEQGEVPSYERFVDSTIIEKVQSNYGS